MFWHKTRPSSKAAMVGSTLPTSHFQGPQGHLCTRALGIAGATSEDLNLFLDLLLVISPVVLYRFALQTGQSRSALQKPFGFQDWEDTQQDGRYVNLVKAVTGLDVLQRLQGPLLLLNLVSAAALFYDDYAVPRGAPDLTLPGEPFTFGFMALGLLLAFRATQSRTRFARARDLWDDILNISRNLYQNYGEKLRRDEFMELARWIPAFPAALLCHLRRSDPRTLRGQLRKSRGPDHEAHEVPEIGGLTEVEIAEVLNRPSGVSAPLFVLHRLTAIVTRLKLPDEDRLQMTNALSRLSNIVGACEELSPMPMGYVKQTTRFLFLYLILLPLGLLQELGAGTVLVEQLIAFSLLGIENVAALLEEPFLALPIDQICAITAQDSQALRNDWDRLSMGGRSQGLPWYAFKPDAAVLSQKMVAAEEVEMQYT